MEMGVPFEVFDDMREILEDKGFQMSGFLRRRP